jgi:hypothetical protein
MRNSRFSEINFGDQPWKVALSFLKWLLISVRHPKWLLVAIFGSSLLFPLTFRVLKSLIPINESLYKLIQNGQYDLIIFPSGAYEATSVDLTHIAKKEKIPSLCLVDNWDNLSSKTLMWARPSHLGVWGEQAKQFALSIHGFTPEKVTPIGTPRFEGYFSGPSTQRSRLYPFPYILFVGSAIPFDELAAIRNLERALNSTGRKDLRIVYRPHPWQQKRKTDAIFTEDKFSRTILDRQIALAYEQGVSPETANPSFQPDLDYYPSLLRNAEAVVGPLTTMLLEASLCQTPVVGLSYHDGFHFNPARGYLTHFDGFEAVAGFTFCQSPSDLSEKLTLALETKIDPAATFETTRFYLHQDSRTYDERLGSLVNGILETEGAARSPQTPKA